MLLRREKRSGAVRMWLPAEPKGFGTQFYLRLSSGQNVVLSSRNPVTLVSSQGAYLRYFYLIYTELQQAAVSCLRL
jgi:hypothetical protein